MVMKMNIFEEMELKKKQFTKTDHAVYAMIRKFPDEISSEKVNDLAISWNISQAALTRFAKKLGFTGFTEFQYYYRKALGEPEVTDQNGISQQYASVLSKIESICNKELLQGLAEHMLKADIVYAGGASLSRLPVEYMLSLSRFFGKFRCIQIDPVEKCSSIRRNDMVMIFSADTGFAYKKLSETLDESDERPYSVLITFNEKHPLRKHFDQIIVMPSLSPDGIHSTAPGEPISFLFFLNLLYTELDHAE